MPRRRRVIEQIEDLAQQIYQRQILPGRRIEADLEGSASRPRRKITMPRRTVRASGSSSKKRYGDPVYTWAFRSSQPRGGQYITYETRLEEDGMVRCNCPGWIFCKGEPATKTCKHKTQVLPETEDILRRFRRGERLEMFDENFQPVDLSNLNNQGTVSGRLRSDQMNLSNRPKTLNEESTTRIRHGRVIQFDM